MDSVDDLRDLLISLGRDPGPLGLGAEGVVMSETIAFHATKGFFESRPCLGEFLQAHVLGKRAVCILEPDPKKGGLSLSQVREMLEEAHRKGFCDDGSAVPPTAEQLFAYLTVHEPVEWSRIQAFQE
jgi:hypothetical protein